MIESVGFVGLGRFGLALAGLFRERGVAVRAYDPGLSGAPPAIELDSTLKALVSKSQAVFVAVPVSTMGSMFTAIRPYASADHVIVDVGSVKLGPSCQMEEAFGRSVPWVASHPLFGPISIAHGEPLRAVICPNGLHDSAESEVADLYRGVGCAVVAMGAEPHDRLMATTHALAFFVAKGLLDIGVPTDSPAAPPSFQAMARTIESVRGDAGHLLSTLHRENPFAAEYRSKLLDALEELDRVLSRADGGPVEL